MRGQFDTLTASGRRSINEASETGRPVSGLIISGVPVWVGVGVSLGDGDTVGVNTGESAD